MSQGAESKVWVVEDEQTQLRLLQSQLQQEGYQVITATNGREALQTFQNDPEIRLVITDLMMPEMDGFALIQALRANESRCTYIIVQTHNEDSESLTRALALGADDYLVKPVCGVELSLRLISGRQMIRIDGQDEIILAMIKMTGAKTGETGGHLHRVRAYTKILAMDLINNRPELQLTRRKAEDIARVSPLHDIGMMAISDAIINKPGRLSVEEIDLMKTHALVGGELLQEIHERTGLLYLHLAYEVASGHHERWDGSGYPKGLCGTDIPLAARIIAFADVFDALTTERCYKTAFSYEQAKKMVVAASGRHFDPMVVEAYLRQEVAWVAVMKQYQ